MRLSHDAAITFHEVRTFIFRKTNEGYFKGYFSYNFGLYHVANRCQMLMSMDNGNRHRYTT